MARRVFFSFHYDDVWRVNQIRKSWIVRRENEAAGFMDKADFEKVERQGRAAIERWIDRQLQGTSATVVLIGDKTASRPYVQYEIRQSYERGNALLGIWIDNLKDQDGSISVFRGSNPFDNVYVPGGFFGQISIANKLNVPLYDWAAANGRDNIAHWIEAAPRNLGN